MIKYLNRRFRNLPAEHMSSQDQWDEILTWDEINAGKRAKPTTDWCGEQGATLVTSVTDTTKHLPVIDLDVESFLVPSTTEGHSHLYINVPVTFDGLVEILTVLNKHGIVQDGYLRATVSRGYSAVRYPGTPKIETVSIYEQQAQASSRPRRNRAAAR